MTVTRRVKVRNPMGMHARPAGRFVDLARGFDAKIRVRCRGEEVDGHSILSLLMLEAVVGTELEIIGQGDDAEPFRVVAYDLDGLRADRAGGTEQHDLAGAHRPSLPGPQRGSPRLALMPARLTAVRRRRRSPARGCPERSR